MSALARRLASAPDWAWLALAFLLRAGFALALGGRLIQIDEGAFRDLALSLVRTGAIGPPGTVIAPLPTWFNAAFLLVGPAPVLPRLGQAALSTATAWLLGRAARELTGSPSAGRLTLALSAVYPFFIYYSGTLMSETLYLACLTGGLLQLYRSLLGGPEGRLRAAALAGLWLGLSALARAEGAYIWAVIWALSTALCAARRWPWKAWVAAVACWALPILGWSARNQAEAGRFALDTHGGITLLCGTMFFELNEIDTRHAFDALHRAPFWREAERLPPAEQDRFLQAKAFEFMRENPRRVLRQWAAKAVNFWRFYPRTDKPYEETATSRPSAGLGRKALVAISLLFEPALILFGLAGLAALARRRVELLGLPLFVLGTMGVHLLSVSQMRYRLPVMPLLILGACALAGPRLDRTLEG
ncbi:MAG: glycosyltransferase family 39 protein [Elusimicrobia bacterium]|nr:glycosyltransferase family 39 protein [Elusimicrobiota bacterium]